MRAVNYIWLLLVLIFVACKKESVNKHFIDGTWYVTRYVPSVMLPDTGSNITRTFSSNEILMKFDFDLKMISISNSSALFPISSGSYEFYIAESAGFPCSTVE